MIRPLLRRAYRSLWPILYSRSQYKLFLKASLGNLDLRVQELASMSDYFSGSLQPIPIRAPFGNSMLVVAPHQDDEAIGCGGALALQVRSGCTANIVIVQDGGDGHEEMGLSRQELRDMRNKESERSAAVLGLVPKFLNHPRLQNAPQAVDELYHLLETNRVDAVFTPYLLDGHPDHRTTNVLLAQALERVSWDVRVLGYEVWGLCIPNVMVVIDDVIEQKVKMLDQFVFANQALNYTHSTKGLNMYRSRLLGADQCLYAECFFEMPRLEFIALVRKLQATQTAAG